MDVQRSPRQYVIALIRSGYSTAGKHAGLTQLIIDMQSDGLSVSPIEDITGGRDFSEIALDSKFVPDDHVLAHPIVGAMGFTVEFPLHLVTRRLWAWREEDGSELYWNRRIGAMVSAEGASGLWPLLSGTARPGRSWQP